MTNKRTFWSSFSDMKRTKSSLSLCHYFQLSALLFMRLWNSSQSVSAAIGYKVTPGTVHVLENSTLTLNWQVGVRNSIITACYWERSKGAGILNRFLGYDNVSKKRYNYTQEHTNWHFMDEELPCTGGLMKKEAAFDSGGIYCMYWNDEYSTSFAARAEVIIVRGERINIRISQVTSLPPSDVTVYQEGDIQTYRMIDEFQVYASFEKQPSNGSIIIHISSSVDGVQYISIYQPVTVSELDHCVGIRVAAGLSITFMLVSVCLITLFVIIGWKRGRVKYKKNANRLSVKFPSFSKKTDVDSEERQRLYNNKVEHLHKHRECFHKLSDKLDDLQFSFNVKAKQQKTDEIRETLQELEGFSDDINSHEKKLQRLLDKLLEDEEIRYSLEEMVVFASSLVLYDKVNCRFEELDKCCTSSVEARLNTP
ncbi:hypothetical protein LSH36_291g05073 [Paralvinella palmiformis]|uniref:Uncharacterized protein n=1 Tax=Paralvinella palmiformis TaxID=53620 RepID=A0AAD9JK00_9ANNE|nr:hypothetical protein LSH36_291g05073 [Paralvinella palmiformis]